MSTPSADLRLLLQLAEDLGQSPSCVIDTDLLQPLSLSGFEVKSVQTVSVGPSATDQVFTFTAASVLILVSDQPFKLRLAAAETLLGPMYATVLWGSSITTAVHSTGILLTGNGSNTAKVTAVVVEKTT